jgi:hypothetical protein
MVVTIPDDPDRLPGWPISAEAHGQAAARVRLLDSGKLNKTDDNDAGAVRSPHSSRELTELTVEDQTIVVRVVAPLPRSWSAAHASDLPAAHTAL